MITVEGFETVRLRAEPIGREHRDWLVALMATSAASAGTRFAIARQGTLVARGGPHRRHVAGNDEVEIGWTVVPDRWNQGIATELGAASLEVAFGPLALPDAVSFTLPHNHGSRRVMEKLGFAYERDTDYNGRPHVLYRLGASAQRERLGEALEHRRDRGHAPARDVYREDRPLR